MRNFNVLKVFFILAIVFSISILNLVSQNYLNIPRSYFVYESFLIIPVAYFVGPITGSILLFIFLTLDLINHIGLVYFHNFFDILTNFKFFKSHNYFNFYLLLQCVLLCLAWFFYLLVSKLRTQIFKSMAIFSLLFFFTIASLDKHISQYHGFIKLLEQNNISYSNLKNFSDSLFYSFYRDYLDLASSENLETLIEYEKANNIFYDEIIQNHATASQNVLLIIVESLGFIKDENIRSYLLDDLKNHKLKYKMDVEYKSLDAEAGSTVTAEFRELCGVKLSDYSSDLGNLNCIAETFKSAGYQVYAAHPYLSGYFDRRNWWKDIGFSNYFFMSGIKKDNLPTCSGSYKSICDDSFFEYVFDYVSQEDEPFFLYYLSIEGHLPTKFHTQQDYDVCISETSVDKFICGNLISNKKFLEAVFNTLENSNLENLKVFIVGDHVPKSILARNKEIYHKNEVQVITLKSKL